MRRFLTLLVTLVVFGASSALAQTKQVSGKVTSAEDNQPIPGANVFVKEAPTVGTMTDVQGNYIIKSLPSNAKTLVFSFIGYQSMEMPINGAVINSSLKPDNTAIEEVIVVGYGSAKKVGTVVGSVASVKSDKLKDKPTSNALESLQGKVAGLQVYTSSGEPTAVSSIRLHGVGSLGASSTPLYVLDGAPISNGTMLTLNPNDFESVSVLKDASATSIYGSRAANGVVYITTKRGSVGEKAKVNFNAQYGISKLADTDYFENFMSSKELSDFWVGAGYRTQDQMDALLAKYPNNTKWYKYYYKDDAPTYQTDVSISGGTGRTNYFISAGYFFQDGLSAGSEYEKYTFRSNINSKANSWLSFGVNLTGSSDSRQTNPYDRNSTNRGLGMLAQPWYTPYDANGNKYPDLIPGWNRYNPEYLVEKQPSLGNQVQFNGTGFVQLNPVKGLTIKSQLGLEAYDYTLSQKRYPSFKGSLGNGMVYEGLERVVTKSITNTV